MHRSTKLAGLLCLAFCSIVGCDQQSVRQLPIATGKVVSGTIWERPVQRPGETGDNTGNAIVPGSRVEVYENFIIVTPPNKPSQLCPHGWYTNLSFEKN